MGCIQHHLHLGDFNLGAEVDFVKESRQLRVADPFAVGGDNIGNIQKIPDCQCPGQHPETDFIKLVENILAPLLHPPSARPFGGIFGSLRGQQDIDPRDNAGSSGMRGFRSLSSIK